MKQPYRLLLLLSLLLWTAIPVMAQLKGVITDSISREPLIYISVFYEGKGVGSVSNGNGEYAIETRKGWNELTFSAIGYHTRKIRIEPGKHTLNVQMVPTDVQLDEVVITPQKERYSRKNNPAVEFMRKVIAHKRAQKLEENDYYQYHQYEKMKASLSGITPQQLKKGIYRKYAFLKSQIEVSATTNSLILPLSIEETSSQVLYRKEPESRKTLIQGVNSNGIHAFMTTGDMLGTMLKEIFTNVNLYDDDIRLLQHRFTSPIAPEAIGFYKYYLMDTLVVERDSCIHLSFVPQNAQDFGFTGHLYVLKDSTYAVKQCVLNLPKKTGVNFIDQLEIVQQYTQLPSGNWVLADDDMRVSLSLFEELTGVLVERTTKYTNYAFDPIDPHLLSPSGSVIKAADMLTKSDAYWAEVRQVPLTQTESRMSTFMEQIEEVSGFKYVVFGAKALIENFVETGGTKRKSYFDFGPVNTTIGSNYVDGLRLRLSGMTTAHLHPHWFVNGYGAYGFKDRRWKYSGTLTYSFLKREQSVWEYPKHFVSATYSYDVMSPMDKFLFTDKDNVFLALKATTVDQMSYIRDVTLRYEAETLTGWGIKTMLRRRNDEPTGALHYLPAHPPTEATLATETTPIHDITTTEANLTLRYAPGESFINSKQRRIPVTLDAPIFTLSHTAGFKGVLGGEYAFNRTEASLWKRFWLPSSWGKLDISLKGGVEWNTVPFPLLILPEANLSYITQREAFCLLGNMEFLNDRFASLSLSYDMNGKLFNRIPLFKQLKWREMFRVRALWGTLTDKNNPFVSNNPDLFLFPQREGVYTSHTMNPRMPYVEASVGVYNIFKLLHVEYVHRLTYRDLPGTNQWGFRFMIMVLF